MNLIFCGDISAAEKNTVNGKNHSQIDLESEHRKSQKNIDSITRLNYVVIDKREYISLTRFKGIVKKIQIHWDPLLLTVKMIHGKKIVKIQVDSNFFISNGDQYSLEFAPIFHRNEVYLPRPLVEELFTELNLALSYKFEEKNISIHETVQKEPAFADLDFIVIDPGHGGKDPGAFAVTSAMEKKIALDVSNHLKNHLKKEFPNIKVYMTRYKDEFVTLEKRSDFANDKLEKNNFGIFISLHCNATLRQDVRGYEIFYLSQNPGSEEDRKVMMRENDLVSSGDPDSDIGMIESYLLNSQVLSESKMLARQLNRTLLTELKGKVSSRGVRKADFRVLRKSLMPAVLVEMGYISNTSEVVVLQTDLYKEKLAVSIANGIRNFIKYRPKM